MNTRKETPVELTPSETHNSSPDVTRLISQSGFVTTTAVKFGVFIAVASTIAVVAYFGAQQFLLSDDDVADDRRAVAVQRGTLLDDITASGSVSFPELESLRFDISGTVGEILVEEGESVGEGQPLILLDDVTISSLESAVANAEITLQDAGEDLAELLGGATSLERAIAESNLADARVASMNAASALAEYTSEDGADSPATTDAKSDLAEANEALADAISAAEDDAQAENELVEAAQEAYDDAVIDYSDQITGWFGSVVSEIDRATESSALLESWGTTVDAIFEESTATVDSPPDDPSTPWNESVVWVWTHLTPYPILTNCEYTSYTARCPSAEISDYWDAKVTAEEALIEAQDDAAAAAKAQQVLIDAAQDAVETAAEDVVDTVNDVEINALAATLAEKLELEKDFEETLVTLNDLDSLEIKLATAAVNEANALLQNAKSELASANMSAPFTGIISSISVEPGDPVSRSTPTIDILDPSVVTLDGTIDEIDVLSLKIGDTVAVTLDALPDQILTGVIDEIGDGVNQQGIIEFPLTIALTPPDGIELIEGLSATATIVLNRINNALLIPLQAVGGSFTQATVDVVTENGFTTTNVKLGASDDFLVVVESGLSEGQEVLMTVTESVDPFQQLFGGGGGGIRIPGGAFTGEARRPGGGGR
ncbi:HlyD family efflux transporter periplasmic adaptor subunit [Candidatus Lucifugimonas marina]|uniref:HlyD family efflux transporter periplasmic adaptor subunit n=1 Tax=Candidatus Lucifugimonas marina TaxID=3038979 RepID=A0AAJ5ZDH4_9CHLR|nr:HlyD family efflux transporter periplasmic adaptor subunit [SAR202 cluster bacterium JH702]MDG0868640.1 HlyD family efflux transporter periplasmic adaptor subunit [SAR202 cluster bacterium JH639]WFG39223.1 HlyD family efflux transporter periplasmic adaptor subunit [SAR202 cluster bacterium JH1073]